MIRTQYHRDGTPRERHMGGWKRQPRDARDDRYKLKLHGAFTAAPPSSDNRPICSPVVDQGNLGSCTANAFGALIESNEIQRIGSLSKFAREITNLRDSPMVTISGIGTDAAGRVVFTTTVAGPTPPPDPAPPVPTPPTPAVLERVSRLFEYYATRTIEGTVSEDSGATIRDAIKAGADAGVADEAVWPYDVSQFATKPPDAVYAAATTHKVTSYHAIDDGDLETMKSVLSAGNLIEFGFTVYESFMSAQTAQTGVMPMPKPGEQLQGGHAVALVGHDDAKQAFLVRNSWGTDWGLAGYFYMPYAFVGDTKQASDFWVVISSPI